MGVNGVGAVPVVVFDAVVAVVVGGGCGGVVVPWRVERIIADFNRPRRLKSERFAALSPSKSTLKLAWKLAWKLALKLALKLAWWQTLPRSTEQTTLKSDSFSPLLSSRLLRLL